MDSLPATMRAAVYRGPGELALEERPVPVPGSGEALVAVSHCGVCGTDLHLVLDGWGRAGTVPGHEWAGRVAAVGPDVAGWRPGDAAVGGPAPACGACADCARGRPALCAGRDGPGGGGVAGAFAEYVCVPAARLLRPPDGLSLRVAALAEPLAVALHALTLGRVAPGQRALVTGAGPLGLLTIAALRARGLREVVASEPAPGRRERALAVGARAAVAPEELRVPRMPYEVVEDPADVAFECSGRADAMESALGRLARGGTLVLVGTGMKRPRFDPNRILLNELVVTGAYTYDENGPADALALLASGALPTDALIEPHDVTLDAMLPALHRLARGEIPAKVMVAPNGADATGARRPPGGGPP